MTATPSAADARWIADALVKKRLAGCVQVVGPISSTYRWKGRLERTREWLCLVKTSREQYNELVTVLEALHPYDTPEILAFPITNGSRKYLAWLARALEPGARRRLCR